MIRPLHDWVLVKFTPPPKEERAGSLIVLGSNVERVLIGVVERFGPGQWDAGHLVPTDLNVGDRVAFFRENLETSQGKRVTHILSELGDYALIRESSILYKWVS